MRRAWLFASIVLLSGCARAPADPGEVRADPLADEHARDVTSYANVTLHSILSFADGRFLLEATVTNEGSTNATLTNVGTCVGSVTITIVAPWGERRGPAMQACAAVGPTVLAPSQTLRVGDHFGPTYRNEAGSVVPTEAGEYLLVARAHVQGEPYGMRLQQSHRIVWPPPEQSF